MNLLVVYVNVGNKSKSSVDKELDEVKAKFLETIQGTDTRVVVLADSDGHSRVENFII